MKFPDLFSNRIILKEIGLYGLKDMYEYSKIESFYQFLEFPPQKSINDTKEYLIRLLKRHKNDNAHYWFVELKETGRLPGAEGGRIGYRDGSVLPQPKPEEVYLDKRLEKLQRAKKKILDNPDAFDNKGKALIQSINNDIAQLRKEYVAIEKIPGHATGGVSNLFRRR